MRDQNWLLMLKEGGCSFETIIDTLTRRYGWGWATRWWQSFFIKDSIMQFMKIGLVVSREAYTFAADGAEEKKIIYYLSNPGLRFVQSALRYKDSKKRAQNRKSCLRKNKRRRS